MLNVIWGIVKMTGKAVATIARVEGKQAKAIYQKDIKPAVDKMSKKIETYVNQNETTPVQKDLPIK